MSPIQYLKANGYNPEKVIEIKSLNISDYSFDKIIKNIVQQPTTKIVGLFNSLEQDNHAE